MSNRSLFVSLSLHTEYVFNPIESNLPDHLICLLYMCVSLTTPILSRMHRHNRKISVATHINTKGSKSTKLHRSNNLISSDCLNHRTSSCIVVGCLLVNIIPYQKPCEPKRDLSKPHDSCTQTGKAS